MRGHELTDEEWATLEPLLPPSRPATGRPNKNHRTILNGILWILRTGAPWRDLPERYGSWRTVYSRFRRWQQAGVWDRVLRALQSEAAYDDRLDGTVTMIDSSNIRAHQHAAGARKGGASRPGARQEPRRLGQQAASGERARRQAYQSAAERWTAARECGGA